MGKKSNFAVKVIQLIFFAFVAKGFGFVREIVLANYYGTSYVSDVYVAVQNIPAIIFTIFGTAVTTGFIPLYTEVKIRKNKESADTFANNVFNIFLLLSLLLTTLGVLFSKQLVKLFAGGFKGETFILCNQYAKIIMPTCIAIILVYVYNAYLQIEGYFNQNSLMNVPYNLIQIVFIAIGFYSGNSYILAVGLLLASFGQLVYLRVLVKKKTDFKHKPVLNFRDTNIRQMLILVGPVFISTGVNQLNSIVDRSMASGLVEGSVSALNYSSEVANMVTQVVILSLTTILYPKMTELFARNDKAEKNSFTLTYINVVSLLVLPLAALIFVFSKEIVQILFGRGAFNENTVVFVSRALKIYALGIVGASFRDVLHFRKSDEPPWSAKAVDRILHNEVYTGKLVQGKTRRLDYRSKKKMNVPMRDWTIVDNTHEAIIPAEQFELVQRILETETRRPNDAETVALFAGFLYCGDCGSRLVRRSASYKGKRYIYYQCSGSKQNKESCTSHNLRDEKLYNIVRNALQMQIQIVMEEAEFVESIRQAQQEPYRVRRIERQIRQLTAEKAHTQGIKEKLYGDYADEILTREDFLNYNELYSKRIEEYDRKITELEAEQQNLQTAPNAYPFLDVYRKYRKLEEITRPMVVELIEKIEVYEGNRVEITFRFQDEIADLLEELHQKQHEVSA